MELENVRDGWVTEVTSQSFHVPLVVTEPHMLKVLCGHSWAQSHGMLWGLSIKSSLNGARLLTPKSGYWHQWEGIPLADLK